MQADIEVVEHEWDISDLVPQGALVGGYMFPFTTKKFDVKAWTRITLNGDLGSAPKQVFVQPTFLRASSDPDNYSVVLGKVTDKVIQFSVWRVDAPGRNPGADLAFNILLCF